MRKAIVAAVVGVVMLGGAPALIGPVQSQDRAKDQAAVEAAIKGSWTKAGPEWQARLVQDETQRLCSLYRNAPPNDVANAIVEREKAAIKYPADGKLMGDWKKGEKLAQSGYGMRFTDYPPRQENGGNCYACHQLDKKELSFGTLGPGEGGLRAHLQSPGRHPLRKHAASWRQRLPDHRSDQGPGSLRHVA
jgi:sulfur-oxidizing protein SoxX